MVENKHLPPGYAERVRRSEAQNRKMRAQLTDVSRSKPEGREHDPETWKCLFFSAWDRDRRFADAQMIDGLEGRPPVFIGYATSLLTVEEMAELITFIQEYGDRHGVRWSGGDYDMAADPLMQERAISGPAIQSWRVESNPGDSSWVRNRYRSDPIMRERGR